MLQNSKAISSKSFQVLVALLDKHGIDSQVKFVIPWICARMITFEDIKPEIKQENTFNTLNITLNCDENAAIAMQIIIKLLSTGASTADLHQIFAFIRASDKLIIESKVQNRLNYAASFVLVVFILRADDSVIPVSYISEAMKYFKFQPYSVCAPQIIYNSINSVAIRESIFENLITLTFGSLDHTFLLDTRIFNGFSEESRSTLLKPFLSQTFLPMGIDRMKLEALCYWMSHGLVPLEQATIILSKASADKERHVVLKLEIALLRAIFKHPKYRSLRSAAVKDLFFGSDHTLIAPKPAIMGMVSSLADLFSEPEFMDAFSTPPTKYAADIHALIQSEVKRMEKVKTDHALCLSEGIESVLESYNQALVKIYSFNLPLNEKVVIFKSIHANLTRLSNENRGVDHIDLEFTAKQLDDFVRVAIYLAIHIFTDATGPAFSVEMERETVELILACLVQHVRDSNVQGLLVHHLFDTLRSHPTALESILELLPKYINWRRFILLAEDFRLIFNLNGSVQQFDKFVNEVIEAAFRFEDHPTMDAIDLSRNSDQSQTIHGSFFMLMTSLIQKFNLPVKYTLNALQLMNQNPGAIEIISPHLIQFLRVAIKVPKIDNGSVSYRITRRSYGGSAIFHNQSAVIQEILFFLSHRPDFVDLALLNDRASEAHQFMLELKQIANGHELYHQPTIQMFQTFFEFPAAPIESLNLVHAIDLPAHVIKNVASWFSLSKNTSHESVVQIALLAVNLAPANFNLETFTNNALSCNSWLPISVSIIQWISKLSSEFSHKFAQEINQATLQKFLNLLLCNLEYDGTEEFISKAFLSVLDAITLADDSLKYNFINLLGTPQIRPLTRNLRLNHATNLQMCSVFRLWTSITAGKFEKQAESLIWSLLEDEITFTEDEIVEERTSFMLELKKLDSYETFEDVMHCITEILKKIQALRSMHEVDLVLTFIKKLSTTTRRFYSHVRSKDSSEFSSFLGITLHLLRSELLLQADSSVFFDFFKFVFKHAATEKCNSYFDTVDLLFSQMRTRDIIQRTLAIIINDLRLEASLIPGKGFPKHFYEHNSLLNYFVQTYLEKMNVLGSRTVARHNGIKGVALDGIHFLMLFNILHEMNASDDLFKSWFENISRIHENDLCGNAFAQNLKAHCIKRPNLVDNLIRIYINEQFVGKTFNTMTEPSKGNIMTVFKLMLKSNSKLYQECVALLSPYLQKLMNDTIGASYLLMKQKLVQDFIDKCRLSELNTTGFNFAILLPNLVTLLKMEIIGVIPADKYGVFFAHLLELSNLLFKNDHPSQLDLNLMTIVLALQSKNQIWCDPLVLDRVIRLQRQEQTEEASNLLLKQVLGKNSFNLCSQHVPFLAKLIIKSTDPNQILFDIFKHQILSEFTVKIIQNILNTPRLQVEINTAVQAILSELISSKGLGSEFKLLFSLAKIYKLLSKTQLLLLDQLN